MDIKGLLRFGHRRPTSPSADADRAPETRPEIVRVTDDLDLQIQGLPTDISSEHKKEIIYYIVRKTLSSTPEKSYRAGEKLAQGSATIMIDNGAVRINFSLSAARALAALAMYKNAFDLVALGAASGSYDQELAEDTAKFLKNSAWEEMLKIESEFTSQTRGTLKKEDDND